MRQAFSVTLHPYIEMVPFVLLYYGIVNSSPCQSDLVTLNGKSGMERYITLTLHAPIAAKDVCFFRLLKCLRSLCGKQCGPRSDCSIGAVCSGSMLFASGLNLSLMLGNYLQQTTSADNIFRCIFFLPL